MNTTMIGQLATPQDAQKFLFAGNAILTLKSLKTGTRFTYKVQKSEDGRAYFVKVLTGADNTNDYQYLGQFLGVPPSYSHGKKSALSRTAPSALAFAWFVKQLDGLSFSPSLEVWHEGRCCRCGRTLTVPSSVKSGIGPECAGKMGVMVAEEFLVPDDLVQYPDMPAFNLPSIPAKTLTIKVSYSSLDSYGKRTTRTFKTLNGARKYAQEMVGRWPSIGTGYAVSDDGIGKIEVQGCGLEDLFPSK